MRLQNSSFMVKILRLLLYKSASCLRQCRNQISQMSWITSIQTGFASLSRSKKILLVGIVVAVIVLYMWPSWLSFRTPKKILIEPGDLCIDAKLQGYSSSVNSFDVLVNHEGNQEAQSALPGEYPFHAFVGNGYIGVSLQEESRLRIKYGRALTLPIPYFPIVHVSIEGYTSKDANVLHIRHGYVEKIQCFETGITCISVITKTLTHRTRPGVLIQDVKIHNPSNKPVTASLEQIRVSDWENAKSTNKKGSNSRQQDVDYTVTVGTIPLPDRKESMLILAVANSKITDTVTLQAGSTWSQQTYTVVRYTDQPIPEGMAAAEAKLEQDKIADLVEKSFLRALNVAYKFLEQEHLDVWQKQFHSGFGISYSKAPGAVNGDQINSTLYYIMSNLPAPIHEADRSDKEKYSLEKLLYFPDRCYDTHPTLQNDIMWGKVESTQALIDVVKTWVITLEKHGCSSMLQAGADGALQAMILSFGAMHFRNEHLEFGTEPKDLHRDYSFRRINYGNNTHVNVSVIVGEDNKAVLYASLDRNDRPYYACDAGCLDAPVKLSKETNAFPVKLTQPLTSILYITADKLHMEELKDAIHVKEIAIAPAHEHHVIALHRHGHHLGGLPMMFWVSIGLLIVIFHLFLFKLIFNEYCQASLDRYSRTSKYNI